MKVVVDPDGDVLLVVGATQPNVSIQVSSKVLSLASKPFKVMFSQSFREGNELVVSNGPYEISLPDDDPDAMVTICKLIHHKDVAPEGSIVAMRSFSVATDKYDTLQACSLYGRAWLDLFCHNAEQRGAGTLSLAHFFQDCGNFKKVSRALLARPQGIAQLRAVPEDATSIPESVIDALMTLRSSIEDHLSENLQMPITKMVTEHTQNLVLRGNCNHQSTQVCDYISELRRLHLWPVQPKHWDFDEVLSDLSEFRNESTSKKKLSLRLFGMEFQLKSRYIIFEHPHLQVLHLLSDLKPRKSLTA
ncbi:hypothetical protein E2P81_ATG04401 [Venturia nashicola]|nr:hypothetical protein E2P81_ATG04401 [Venturia nashicola]